jgi:hypothetical protein
VVVAWCIDFSSSFGFSESSWINPKADPTNLSLDQVPLTWLCPFLAERPTLSFSVRCPLFKQINESEKRVGKKKPFLYHEHGLKHRGIPTY